MKWSQFRKDLDRGVVRFAAPADRSVVFLPQKCQARQLLSDLVSCSERYVFDAPVYPDIAVFESLEAMFDAEVFRLPAPVTLFEVPVDGMIILALCVQREAEIAIYPAMTMESGRSAYAVSPYVGLIRRNPWRIKENKAIGTPTVLAGVEATDDNADLSPEEIKRSFLLDFDKDSSLIDRLMADEATMDRGLYLAKCCISLVPALIVALATRGVNRERMNYPRNYRPGEGRDLPITSHTIVHVRQSSGAIVVTEGEEGEIRRRVRLHLRAGHVRNQPFGPQRTQVRKIWIAPCLVGYEEEGMVLHSEHRFNG
jgi:hypothetical protein